MLQFTITIPDEEEKALLTIMIDIEEWTNNAIHNRARIAINQIIQEHTDKQPNKLSLKDKQKIITELSLETAIQRTERLEKIDIELTP